MTKEEALDLSAIIQRMAEDIDPHAFQEVRDNPDPKSIKYQFWTVYCDQAKKTATKLVAAGWRKP